MNTDHVATKMNWQNWFRLSVIFTSYFLCQSHDLQTNESRRKVPIILNLLSDFSIRVFEGVSNSVSNSITSSKDSENTKAKLNNWPITKKILRRFWFIHLSLFKLLWKLAFSRKSLVFQKRKKNNSLSF